MGGAHSVHVQLDGMEWIHCNGCHTEPSPERKDTVYSLTSCGHIFCSTCIKNKDKFCFVCNSSCNLVCLSKNLPQDVTVYFTPPTLLMDKFISQLEKVVQFQRRHHTNLLKYQLQQYQSKIETKQKEILQLTKEDEVLKSQLNQVSPMSTTPSPALLSKGISLFPPPSSRLGARLVHQSSSPSLYPERRPHPSSVTPVNKRIHLSGGSSPSMATSMTTPSPSSSSSSQLRTPRNNVQQVSLGTLIRPERICVRTPPINGRMGVIPSSSQRSLSSPRTALATTPGSEGRRRGYPFVSPSNSMGPPSFAPALNRKGPTSLTSGQIRPYQQQSQFSRPHHPSLLPYPPFTPSSSFGNTTMRSPIASPMINNIKL